MSVFSMSELKDFLRSLNAYALLMHYLREQTYLSWIWPMSLVTECKPNLEIGIVIGRECFPPTLFLVQVFFKI